MGLLYVGYNCLGTFVSGLVVGLLLSWADPFVWLLFSGPCALGLFVGYCCLGPLCAGPFLLVLIHFGFVFIVVALIDLLIEAIWINRFPLILKGAPNIEAPERVLIRGSIYLHSAAVPGSGSHAEHHESSGGLSWGPKE